MVKTFDDPKHEELTIDAVNMELDEWVYACKATTVHKGNVICETGDNLSHLSHIIPSDGKRKTLRISLKDLRCVFVAVDISLEILKSFSYLGDQIQLLYKYKCMINLLKCKCKKKNFQPNFSGSSTAILTSSSSSPKSCRTSGSSSTSTIRLSGRFNPNFHASSVSTRARSSSPRPPPTPSFITSHSKG